MKLRIASSQTHRGMRSRRAIVRAGAGLVDHAPAWPFAAPVSAGLAVLGGGLLLCVVCASLLDAPITLAARGLPPWLVQAAAWVTVLGLSNYMLVLSGAVIVVASLMSRTPLPPSRLTAVLLLRQRASFFFATIAGSGVAAQAIKHLVGRARPKLLDSMGVFHFDVFSIKASLASFPSGHATSAFAAAATLGLMLPPVRVPLFLLASLVGVSRVAVGAHYLSDVVAGAVLGLVFTLGLAGSFARRAWTFELRGDALVLKGEGLVRSWLRRRRGGARIAA